ncbi:hypothetical protein N7444_001495 [Penicillium canescens]|nr:hypothetical protein N7444_001495 [Penicillium canescens]
MRLDMPLVLGLATSVSALWSVTYYTTSHCSGAGKAVGGFEAGCQTLDTDTESVRVSTDDGNNVTLSTDTNCNTPYGGIPSGVTGHCFNAAIRSFLSS